MRIRSEGASEAFQCNKCWAQSPYILWTGGDPDDMVLHTKGGFPNQGTKGLMNCILVLCFIGTEFPCGPNCSPACERLIARARSDVSGRNG